MSISTGVLWLALAAGSASALKAQGCEVLRSWFVRPPTLTDAVMLVTPCVKSFLQARAAALEVRGVVQNGVEEIVLVVNGPQAAREALEAALDAEQGELLSYPARVAYPANARR